MLGSVIEFLLPLLL